MGGIITIRIVAAAGPFFFSFAGKVRGEGKAFDPPLPLLSGASAGNNFGRAFRSFM